ncbi:hypothetical protein R6U77_02915 [Lysinibacillus louembei]|uniref:Orn/DAP/Arg decarboxylase 2 N-terminal domain-containing protein n=1 Tax=Lysinibacillus louembei TaxID=1470088 RepID=A0ABZ0S0F4_9BACI|nr:hypothetical protein [Lysinibacillus louembei]WPK12668.1 hypothetical protein R6U77_02915 [Lysinibacillus louembei]
MSQILFNHPSEKLYELFKTTPTPAIVFDLDSVEKTTHQMKSDIKNFINTKINFAVKATYNESVLKTISNIIQGCDVASVGEHKLAKQCGFENFTSTSPYYSIDDMKYFCANDVVLDLDSIEQIIQFGEQNFESKKIGLRVAVPIPAILENNASIGLDSRFGLELNEDTLDMLTAVTQKYNLEIVRFHVHTGQTTPDLLIYKLKYLLEKSENFHNLKMINFGGGFLYLYAHYEKLNKTIEEYNYIYRNWSKKNGRKMEFLVEPGSAFVTGNGYLLSKVVALKSHTGETPFVQCDCSFWNLNPWIISNPLNISNYGDTINEYTLCGATLFEQDKMPNKKISKVRINDLLIFPAYGGYVGNMKNFNLLHKIHFWGFYKGEYYEIDKPSFLP